MNVDYHPEGLYVWDALYFFHEGRVHCINMQQPRPGTKRPPELFGSFGHAVSDDFVKWTELGPAFYPGEAGSYDDVHIGTGGIIHHEGVFYLFYGAGSSRENGQHQRVALATSTDTMSWRRHPENPILTPDPRWYCSEGSPLSIAGHGHNMRKSGVARIDCRDFFVMANPNGEGFYGFYAVRIPAREFAASSVIGCCKSNDLIHWEHLPPCFVPEKYAVIEVPEVFELDGRWYLLCLTGNGYGQRNRLSDPNLHMGTIYAVADDPLGPYHELGENVLFGSIGYQGFCARTILVEGERYLFYTQAEAMDGSNWGTITTPKAVRTDESGHLRACYSPRIEKYSGGALLAGPSPVVDNEGQWGSPGVWKTKDNKVTGTCRTDWSLCIFDVSAESFLATVALKILDARSAGIAFRVEGPDVFDGGYVVLLDPERQQVVFTETRDFPLVEVRQWRIERGRTYNLRIVAKKAVFEIFIDDMLAIQLYHSRRTKGRLGLIVEEGTAVFSQLQASYLSV